MNTARFKFRVWDNYCKRYGLPPYVRRSKEECYIYDIETPQENSEWVQHHFVLEQCTGVKDKNGKLIYEGDVVVGSWNTKLVVIWDEVSVEYRVKPLDGGGDREFHYFSSSRYLDDGTISYCHFEIIGNIHDDQFREVTKKVEDKK